MRLGLDMDLSRAGATAHPADRLLVMTMEQPGLQALEHRAAIRLRQAASVDAVGDAAAAAQRDPARQFGVEVAGIDQHELAQPCLPARLGLRLDLGMQSLGADHRAPGPEAPAPTVAARWQEGPHEAGE